MTEPRPRSTLRLQQQALLYAIENALDEGRSPTSALLAEATHLPTAGSVPHHLRFLRERGYLTWQWPGGGRARQYVVLAAPATPEEQKWAEAYLSNPAEAQARAAKESSRRILDLYKRDRSLPAYRIAEETGCSIRTVQEVLEQSGEMPLQPPARRKPRGPVDMDSRRWIVERYNDPEELPIRAIAKATGWGYTTVRTVLATSPEVTLRPRGGARRRCTR